MRLAQPDFHVVANPDGTHAVTNDRGKVHVVCPSNADAWRWIDCNSYEGRDDSDRHYRIRNSGSFS